MKYLKTHSLTLIGIFVGAIAGYLYWQQVGCISGTCPITSTWHNSTAYGALMGGLLFSLFQTSKNDSNTRKI
ncbi:MAG: hypothetical protein EBR19_07680 [Chitinophagaceae bacterium]|nr:hypothetical protein [Chitinophagaceae bacterium]